MGPRTGQARDDWTALSAAWRETAPPVSLDPALLRDGVERERRRMTGWVAGDLTVSVIFLAITAYAIRHYPGPWSTFVAADSLAMMAAIWGFTLWNRRGLWKPLGETTVAFINLARLRCTRRLRALSFAVWITVLQVGVVWMWGLRADAGGGGPALPRGALIVPVLVILAIAILIAVSWRRTSRELEELDALAARWRVEDG